MAAAETLIRNYEGELLAGSLAEMEQVGQGVLHQVGRTAVKEWLEGQEGQIPSRASRVQLRKTGAVCATTDSGEPYAAWQNNLSAGVLCVRMWARPMSAR